MILDPSGDEFVAEEIAGFRHREAERLNRHRKGYKK